jgi:enterochelin esterase family protein
MAPAVQRLQIRGAWPANFNAQINIDKSPDGLWTINTPPLPPDAYNYVFIADGLLIADPANPLIQQGLRGPQSIVDIPGTSAAYHALRDVPHGTVHALTYYSPVSKSQRRLHVYTPPNFTKLRRLPVLYLLHGSGDRDTAWFEVGRAARILDNLLSENKAKPMLIVTPDSNLLEGADPATRRRNTELFREELIQVILPLIESTYPVDARREARSLAGLSMGGGQTLNLGLPNLDRFSSLGVFSSGPLSQGDTLENFEVRHRAILSNPARIHQQLRHFWIACGTEDVNGVPNQKALIELLDRFQIRHTHQWTPGGHTWNNWRSYLHQYLPLLFR